MGRQPTSKGEATEAAGAGGAGLSSGQPTRLAGGAPERRARVTLDDIARRCGLSRMSVSYALRGDRRFVSESNLAKVQAAAAALGYDPALSHAARRLRYQQHETSVTNHLAGVFFPVATLCETYWATIYQGLQKELLDHRYGVLSCSVDVRQGSVEEQLPHVFRRGDVDGAIVFPTEEYREPLVDGLRQTFGFGKRPVVTVIESLAGCSAVVADDEQIGYLAARHLLELGHRHLLCFESSRYTSELMRQRLAGHRRAIRDRGLSVEECLLVGGWIWEGNQPLGPAIAELLRRWPQTTGILTTGDGMGIRLARALRQLGYLIPEELSIIGVDDCEQLLDQHDVNIWTTVRIPLHEMGRMAAHLLLARIAGEPNTVSRCVLTPELMVRGTTAPPGQKAG